MKNTLIRVLACGALLWGASPAVGELVVLTDGSFFKVVGYEVSENRMRLSLPSGGRLALPLSRIERVVDDEIVPEPEPVPEPAGPKLPNLRFDVSAEVPSTPFGDLIFNASQRHDLNPRVVAAVVRAESAFDRRAVSHAGARGLMQLMPATASRFGVRQSELFEPARNIEAGTRYLSWLLDRFGDDLPRVLAAYNAGEGAVDRYGGVPPYRETRNYIRRIYRSLDLPPESGLPTTAK